MMEMDQFVLVDSDKPMFGGQERAVLAKIDQALQQALQPKDVNKALDVGVRHFSAKRRINKFRTRDQAFADQLEGLKMTQWRKA
jgi:hypothetical protein